MTPFLDCVHTVRVCACVWVHNHIHMHIYICTIWRSEIDLGYLQCHFFNRITHWMRHHDSLSLTGQHLLGLVLSCLPRGRIISYPFSSFMWIWEVEFRSSCLGDKHFTDWDFSIVPWPSILCLSSGDSIKVLVIDFINSATELSPRSQNLLLFEGYQVFHCVYIHNFLFPSISWQMINFAILIRLKSVLACIPSLPVTNFISFVYEKFLAGDIAQW